VEYDILRRSLFDVEIDENIIETKKERTLFD